VLAISLETQETVLVYLPYYHGPFRILVIPFVWRFHRCHPSIVFCPCRSQLPVLRLYIHSLSLYASIIHIILHLVLHPSTSHRALQRKTLPLGVPTSSNRVRYKVYFILHLIVYFNLSSFFFLTSPVPIVLVQSQPAVRIFFGHSHPRIYILSLSSAHTSAPFSFPALYFFNLL